MAEDEQKYRISNQQDEIVWEYFKTRLVETETHFQKRTTLLQWVAKGYIGWLATQNIRIRGHVAPMACTGSVQLNTTHNLSDTDIIFFAPPHVKRENFLGSFAQFLQVRAKNQETPLIIDQVVIRQNAFVPLIRLRINSMIFDFLYATLSSKIFYSFLHYQQKEAKLDNPEFMESLYLNPERRERCLRNMDGKSYLR